MKCLLILLTCFSVSLSLKAQETIHEICGYQNEVERITKRQPNFLIWQDAWYQEAMKALNSSSKRDILEDTLYLEIPVVFHVLYNKSEENISTNLILDQLLIINEAFRKLNADTTRIRSIFKPIAADVKIQFVMASIDPQGQITDGINRISTTKTTYATNINGAYSTDMKYTNKNGIDAWDPTKFLNIWICNMAYPNYRGITYGFATPPTGAPNWNPSITKDSTNTESGVVLHYRIVGSNNPLAPSKYIEGKAAVHEVGHYLGLRHVWGDGNSTTGCSLDDGIFDTPNARWSNSICTGQNSCTDSNGDLPDQTENYMDYALDGCAAMFTNQQAYMMRFVLNNFRTGLPKRYIQYDTIADPLTSFKFNVYPNPSNGSNIKIRVDGPQNQKLMISINDVCGKEVFSQVILSSIENTIDVQAVANSMYILLLKNSEGKLIDREILVLN